MLSIVLPFGIFWVVFIRIIKLGALSDDFNFLSWMEGLKPWSLVVFNFQVCWTMAFCIKETFKNRKEGEKMWLLKQTKSVISLVFLSWSFWIFIGCPFYIEFRISADKKSSSITSVSVDIKMSIIIQDFDQNTPGGSRCH